MIAGDAVTVPESASGDLRFFPDPIRNGSFALSCRAIFDDGSMGACTCQIESSGDCTEPVSLVGFALTTEAIALDETEIAGRTMAMIENEARSLYIA